MIRTIISLDPDDKRWLDGAANRAGLPMTELVREAVRRMRRQQDADFENLLRRTSGLWRKGDGLAYQRRLRKQWR